VAEITKMRTEDPGGDVRFGLVDLKLPDMDGLQLITEIVTSSPKFDNSDYRPC
jgi:CheY-like chemotaxis protein